jgi:hypothetical protein
MTSTWHSLDSEADRVVFTTTQQSADTCSLLKDAISVLADGFTEAEVKGTDSARAQAGLFSQNLNSLKCSVDLSMRGYYTQSTELLRGVYENWIAFHYLAEFPIKADLWLDKDRRPPRHSDMLNALGPSFVEDKADARGWYGALCRFAHTDALVVLPHLGSHKGEPCAFIGANYKPDLFRTCAYTISLFISIMFREISHMISADSGWQQRYSTAVEALLQFIENENDEFKNQLEIGVKS